jgi:opacity protein-like surface antigen
MRIGAAMCIGLLLATVGSTAAFAEKAIYLNGGVTFSDLKDDAELFGQGLASQLETQAGGTWTSEKNSRTGFDGGIGFRYAKSPTVGMAVELRYVNHGSQYDLVETSGSGIAATATWKLDYVEIPLLLRVTPGTGKVRPALMLGPVMDIKSSADLEFKAQGQSQTVPVGEGFKSTAFAGLFGAGATIAVTPTSSLDIEARYQLGFTNLLDTDAATFKSTGFSILAGWAWRIGN